MFQLHEQMIAQRYNTPLTELLKELEEDPEAVALFAEYHPNLWDDLAQQGYLCLELDQMPQAFSIFHFLLHYMPDEVAFKAACGDSLNGMKQYIKAAVYYHETIEDAPTIPDAYFYLAENYMLLRHPQYAIPLLQKVIQLTDEQHHLHRASSRLLQYAEESLQQTQWQLN